MSQKTLRLLGIVIAFVLMIVVFHLAMQAGERHQCETWQSRPDLWTEIRIEQCNSVGVPLPVTP